MISLIRIMTLVLTILVLPAMSAEYEVPTKVDNQNRTGDLPFSTSVGTDIERIDVGSGSLIVTIPILSLPGRQMPFNFVLRWEGMFWYAAERQTSGTITPTWTIEKRPYIGSAGWKSNQGYLTWATIKEPCGELPPWGDGGTRRMTKDYLYQDGEGGKHKFLVDTWEGVEICGDFPVEQGTFESFDEANTGTLARIPNVMSTPAIYLEDGTQVAWPVSNESHLQHLNPQDIPDSLLRSFKDSNGNTKEEVPGGLDTLGRSPVTISGTNPIQYQVVDSNGSSQTYTVTLANHTFQAAFGVSHSMYGTMVTQFCNNCLLVSSITLPNNRQYTFQYDSYGMLTQITLPTGGVINYTWWNFSDQEKTYRYVLARTIVEGGQNRTWNFFRSCVGAMANGLCTTTEATVTDPLGNMSVYRVNEGNIVSAKIYDGASSGPLLRQYDLRYGTQPPPLNQLLPVGVKAVSIKTTLENGLVSETQFDYDAINHNLIATREYDFAAGAPGPLLRRTQKTYLHTDHPDPNVRSEYVLRNIINRIIQETVDTGPSTPVLSGRKVTYDSYTGFSAFPTNPASPPAPQHDTNYGSSFPWRGNLTKVEVWRDRSGFGLSDAAWLPTEYQYDIFGNIRSIKDPGGHTTSWNYGDAWHNTTCSVPANSQAFPTDAVNAAGHHIQRTFFPCTYQVQSRKDQNDIDNARAGTLFTYELMNRPFTIGYPGGGQTSFTYSDTTLPLSSTKTVKHTTAASTVTTTVLDDLGRVKKTKVTSDPEGTIFTFLKYDALGRKSEEWNASRCDQETNTSCPADTVNGVSTFGSTKYEYDALGRLKKLIPSDGTTSSNNLVTTFDGNVTTVTDQAGKQRRTFTDALGRLTQVDEPGLAVQP